MIIEIVRSLKDVHSDEPFLERLESDKQSVKIQLQLEGFVAYEERSMRTNEPWQSKGISPYIASNHS